MEYSCDLKEQNGQPTLTIRTRTSSKELPAVMGAAYGAILEYLAAAGGEVAGAPFAAYYNMDVADLDVEIGFAVAGKLAGKDEIQAGELPAGKSASCVFVGPYLELVNAYTALSEWIDENGYEPTGVAYEFYLNDPGETPPEELMTQILFPLKDG